MGNLPSVVILKEIKMYSVVQIGGHQFKVQAGDLIDVQKLDAEVGSSLELEKVLFVGGEETLVGTPQVPGAKVTAKVVRTARARKQIIFKRRPGQWRKKNGHRQHYTSLFITAVEDGKGNKAEVAADDKKAQKFLK